MRSCYSSSRSFSRLGSMFGQPRMSPTAEPSPFHTVNPTHHIPCFFLPRLIAHRPALIVDQRATPRPASIRGKHRHRRGHGYPIRPGRRGESHLHPLESMLDSSGHSMLIHNDRNRLHHSALFGWRYPMAIRLLPEEMFTVSKSLDICITLTMMT